MEDLHDSGRRAPSSFVEAIKNGERGKDPDYVLGFADRASRPQTVVRCKSLGERVIRMGLFALYSMARQLPVQSGIRRPRATHMLDSAPEFGGRVGGRFRLAAP